MLSRTPSKSAMSLMRTVWAAAGRADSAQGSAKTRASTQCFTTDLTLLKLLPARGIRPTLTDPPEPVAPAVPSRLRAESQGIPGFARRPAAVAGGPKAKPAGTGG